MTGTSVIRNVLLRPGPDDVPVPNATVVIVDGLIVRVGTEGDVPDDAAVIDGEGAILVAGLWNLHVHLTTPALARARRRPAPELGRAVADMLTSHGFTTVADLASDPRNTRRLRARIETAEIAGPRIYTAGSAIHPHRGLPFYVREAVPRHLWWVIPTPRTPAAARSAVRRGRRTGADLTKLFTGSYVTPSRVVPMRVDIARAAAEEAHEYGALVFAHTSNREGLRVALDAGVDVIAHVPDETDGVDPLLREAAERGIAMVPTLQMFARTVTEDASYMDPILEATRTFIEAGGRLLFGTDVGYMSDATIDYELDALQRCGLSAPDLLRMLTTGPAELFGVGETTGRIAVGLAADLVLLDGDPWLDVSAVARVRATIRAGRVQWAAPGSSAAAAAAATS